MAQVYIRTVTGKITKGELIQKIVSSPSYSKYPKMTTLPYEHIIQNLCEYLISSTDVNEPKEQIELKNRAKIIKHPFAYYQNLYIGENIDKIANEINETKKFNVGLICDVTNKENGQKIQELNQISKIANMLICTGMSIEYDYTSIEKYSNDLQYNIIYGEDNKIPSFIGELIPKDKFPQNDKEEEVYNMIITDLLNKYNIPVFIKLNANQKKLNINTILPWLKKKKIENKKKIVFCLSINDSDDSHEIEKTTKYILEQGYSIIISLFDCDILDDEVKNNYQIDNYYHLNKALFINKLILSNKTQIDNIMLSNNINFKIQLKEYGGFGYENIFVNYYDNLINDLTKIEIDKIFAFNILNLLEWWTPIEKESKKAKIVKCEECAVEKEEKDKELFRKFDKVFCSLKCMKKYFSKGKK